MHMSLPVWKHRSSFFYNFLNLSNCLASNLLKLAYRSLLITHYVLLNPQCFLGKSFHCKKIVRKSLKQNLSLASLIVVGRTLLLCRILPNVLILMA